MSARLPSAYLLNLGDSRNWRTNKGPMGGQVLEIPSAWNTPTRNDAVRAASGGGPCDCSCSQGQGPNNYPSSGPQNPYQMPGPQSLGAPPMPQKPFQTPQSDPCAMNDEVLRGLGLDPDCMRGSRPKAARKPRKRRAITRLRRRRSQTKLTSKQLFPRATKAGGTRARTRAYTGGRYRTLKNGGCYDAQTGLFTKRSNCR
jgi:hypothetical protein